MRPSSSTEPRWFGTASDYYPVPAGRGAFDVTPVDGAPVPVDLDLAGGGVHSVILVQRDGVLGAELQTGAVGPGSAPAGGIGTGLGGAAAGAGTPAARALPVMIGALAALGLGGAGAASASPGRRTAPARPRSARAEPVRAAARPGRAVEGCPRSGPRARLVPAPRSRANTRRQDTAPCWPPSSRRP